MERKRNTPEKILKHLREAAQMLSEGKTVTQVCKRIGVTEVTCHRWNKESDGATRNSIKRLKELEKENENLKEPAYLVLGSECVALSVLACLL